ncbi:MAG: hypothetical protein LC792_07345 [Actinobacteria bacterium]|nr:hypothetical protein [Actinomycetota bacterium]
MAVAQPERTMASVLIAGAMIGFVVIFAIVCTLLLMAGASLAIALGFATFVAAFGGLGFGTMFGANWYVHRAGEPH